MRSDLTYRFSIVNFSKPDSLYNYGMKPVLYSQIEAERHFVGWSRVGSNIRWGLHIVEFQKFSCHSIFFFTWNRKKSLLHHFRSSMADFKPVNSSLLISRKILKFPHCGTKYDLWQIDLISYWLTFSRFSTIVTL